MFLRDGWREKFHVGPAGQPYGCPRRVAGEELDAAVELLRLGADGAP